MRYTNDYELYQRLGEERRSAFRGRGQYAGFIRTLINYFLRSIPFSVKIFLRKDIGSMTYSIWSIIFAMIWARFILDGFLDPTDFAAPDTIFLYFTPDEKWYWVLYPVWILSMGVVQLGYAIVTFFPITLGENQELALKEDSVALLSFGFTLLILLVGYRHKAQVARFHEKKQRFDPLDQGKSLPLLAVTWVASFFGSTEDINKDRENVRFVAEFWTLALVIYLCWLFGQSSPFLANLAWYFFIGGIGLFIEDRIVRRQLLRDVEARFATEFRAARIEEEYLKYLENQADEVATVSAVSPGELTYLSRPIYKPNGASVHAR